MQSTERMCRRLSFCGREWKQPRVNCVATAARSSAPSKFPSGYISWPTFPAPPRVPRIGMLLPLNLPLVIQRVSVIVARKLRRSCRVPAWKAEQKGKMQGHRPILDHVIDKCRELDPIAVAIVSPLSEVAITATIEAASAGLINPYLVGPRAKIAALAREHEFDLAPYLIVDVDDEVEAAQRGVDLCRLGTCQALMNGSLRPDLFLQPIIADDTGLRLKRRMSHVFVVDTPIYPRTLIITDAAINGYPKLEEKADIVQNAIEFAQEIGIAIPKVAILSTSETVSPNVPSTIDAAALCKMADRGQITGG